MRAARPHTGARQLTWQQVARLEASYLLEPSALGGLRSRPGWAAAAGAPVTQTASKGRRRKRLRLGTLCGSPPLSVAITAAVLGGGPDGLKLTDSHSLGPAVCQFK